jgi:hypothetical protein
MSVDLGTIANGSSVSFFLTSGSKKFMVTAFRPAVVRVLALGESQERDVDLLPKDDSPMVALLGGMPILVGNTEADIP